MRKNVYRKVLLSISITGLLLCLTHGDVEAKDPAYPTKPIQLYITMGAGGSTDLATRALINAANKYIKHPIVPINKTGGGGAIATMAVKTAKPDGYTLGSNSMSTVFVLPFSENAPYGPLTDLTWIMNFGTYVFPAMVLADSPWKTWDDLLKWAKQNPRGVKVGITGAKTTDYKGLTLWQIEKREKCEFTYLVFKGSPQILSAALGGHINLYGSTVTAATMDFLKTGKFRILTYLGKNKIPDYSDIPSTAELYGIEIPDLLAVYGPPELPDYVVKKLEDIFAKAVKDPEFKRIMESMRMPVIYMDRPTLMEHINKTYEKTAKIYEGVK